MSRENVEVVRALYEAWNGPDARHAGLAFIAEDFEWIKPDYAIETGTRHGHQGWVAALDSLEAGFQSSSCKPLEYRDLGDRVLCFTTFIAKTSQDDMPVTQAESHLWTLRNRKIVRLEWFHDRREALKAAGLEE